jgi:K+-sensing histidine kinase KdpD
LIGLITAIVLLGFLINALFFAYKARRDARLQTVEVRRLASVRDYYLRIIAHDLRSPLLSLQGMYELVKYSIQNEKYDDLARISDFIDETGAKTKVLLDNLLNWGLAQQEEVAYIPRKVNLLKSITSVTGIYDAMQELKSFKINISCARNTFVFADLAAVDLILRNLVDNAVKHLAVDQGVIEITVLVEGNNVVTSIKDNGSGISESILTYINLIFQDPKFLKENQTKIGLGMILISKFIHVNKGSIYALSTPESGSTFTFSLPRA